MDPLSITAGSLTIAKLCATCIVSLTTWVGEVRTIDGRIEGFCAEIRNLSNTLDALNSSLLLPELLHAAEAADSTSEGELWKQLHISLDDCKNTMEQLREILDGLKKPLGLKMHFFRRPITQFKESLEGGAIASLRERIIFFNTSLALPLQMMNLVIQLSQKESNIENHNQLVDKVDDLNKKLQRLAVALNLRNTPGNSAGSTSKDDDNIIDHMKSYVKTAETVVSRSSSSNTSSSSTTMVVPPNKSVSTNASASLALSSAPRPLNSDYRRQIESWIPSTSMRITSIRQVFNTEALANSQRSNSTQSTIKDFDLELELTRQYLQNGQNKYDAADWVGAEVCYRKASVKLAANNFHDKIALHSDDLNLKIASACFKQRKIEDAQKLLTQLAVWKTAHDRLIAFAANHMLAEVFLHIKDYHKAEKYALTALKGRKKYCGGKHALYFESVRLIVTIYQAKGDEAEVEAWQAILLASKPGDLLQSKPAQNESIAAERGEAIQNYNPWQPATYNRFTPEPNPRINPFAYLPIAAKKDEAIQNYKPWRPVIYNRFTPESSLGTNSFAYLSKAPESRFTQGNRENLTSPPNGDGSNAKTGTQRLDELFARVVRIAVNQDSDKEDHHTKFSKRITGTLLVLLDPLSITGLSKILSIPVRTIRTALEPMSEVCEYAVTEWDNYPVNMHPLFKDFLVANPTFRRELRWHHLEMGDRCLVFLSDSLRKNICRLPSPGHLKSDVERHDLTSFVPPDLQYACRYWAHHLHQEWSHRAGLRDATVQVFLSAHILHWLEVMSIIKRISEALAMIRLIQEILMLHPRSNPELAAFITDAEQFILRYGSILEVAPLQVYSAALLFSPKESIIRNHFLSPVPEWTGSFPDVEQKWGPCLLMLEGQQERRRISNMVFSPDQRILAIGTADCKLRLWDVNTGLLRHTLTGHLERVPTLAFSPKAPHMASGSEDKTVRVWNIETGRLRTILEGHTGSVEIVVFSSDGRFLASASTDRTVGLWNVETGKRRSKLEGHSKRINAISVSPDGHLLASGSDDCTVRLWEVERGQLWAILGGHTASVNTVAFLPQGHILASASYDKTVRLWNAKTGITHKVLEGHTKSVTHVDVSSNGRIVASGANDGKVCLWDARSGEQLAVLEPKGESAWIKGLRFSNSSRFMIVGSDDETVRLWNIVSGKLETILEGYPASLSVLAISSGGHFIATGTRHGTVQPWETRMGDSQPTLEGHSEQVLVLVLTSDGRFAASVAGDNTVRLWDVRTGKSLRVLGSWT